MIDSAAAPIIDVQEISHSFKYRRALRKISFQVQPQTLHGFVGPNGAGKTTALKLICTLLQPQTGAIQVFGRDVVADLKQIRRRIGFMPDHFSMYRQMTVFEYLDFFAAAYGQSMKQRNRVIDDILTLTDMGSRKDELIHGLSRGMQQRISLARVLVNDPDLMLLDEPASGLDPRARIELMEILRELRNMGKTILISSHILSELAELCDSVTIIDQGRIKFSGAIKHLLKSDGEFPTYRVSLAEGRGEIAEQLKGLRGIVSADWIEGTCDYRIAYNPADTDTNNVLQEIMALGHPIVSFSQERKHLNQAFMELTARGID